MLGAYRILGLLGAGGMGMAFEAVDDELQRPADHAALIALVDGALEGTLLPSRPALNRTHPTPVCGDTPPSPLRNRKWQPSK
jgi:hypothetical protein